MVLFLSVNIGPHGLELRIADGEGSVPALPFEMAHLGISLFDPDRRAPFRFLDHVCDGFDAGEREEQMDVIGHSADQLRLTLEISENAAQVPMRLLAQRLIA